MSNFVEELRWRGMLADIMPGTEDHLNKGMTTGYIGFDPTADSLGVGNMVQVMTLLHFQRCTQTHCTGRWCHWYGGRPSGKSAERNLLDEAALRHNVECQQNNWRNFWISIAVLTALR